mgnify:CR=1 FL=1
MIYASQYKCSEAIEFYSRSIDAHKNPAPYLNRANLFGKRIRYFEALQDLQEAQRLDRNQAKEFSAQIHQELTFAELITENYTNGIREKLIIDFKSHDKRSISEKILCASFGMTQLEWEHDSFDWDLVEYHFFNEIDNISKFDERNLYPEALEFIELYPEVFIQKKINTCSDYEKYRASEILIHSFLCCYDEADMQRLRRSILYEIHCKLLERDYGWRWRTLSTDCEGVTKDAANFIANQR